MRLPATVLALAAAALGSAAAHAADLSDAQQVIADLRLTGKDKSSSLTIAASAPRSARAGGPITISFQVNKAASVAVLRVMPNGMTTIVFPSKAQPNAQVPANTPVQVPGPVTGDKGGTALFEFIASTGSGSWLFSRKPAGDADFAELGPTTRALAKGIATSFEGGRGGEMATTHLIIDISQ